MYEANSIINVRATGGSKQDEFNEAVDVRGQELHDKSKHVALNGMGADRTGTQRASHIWRWMFYLVFCWP